MSLEKGVDQLVQEGARTVCIVPMFIFDGMHVTYDIPEELEGIKAKYPEVEIRMSSHIGDDDKLAEIIVDRINSIA